MATRADLAADATSLTMGEPIWQGRNALAPMLLVALPILVFVTFFIAILWIAGPNLQSGYWRVGGLRVPMSPAELKASGWFFVTVVPLMLGLGATYPIWRIRRVRMTITSQAIVVKDGRLKVVWPMSELRKLSFRDNLGWYAASFSVSSGKPPRILVSGNDAILLANVAERLGLESELPERLAIASDLAIGEAVKWSGRRGFRAFKAEHGVALVLIATPALLYAWWMWAIWKDFEWVSFIRLLIPLMWSLTALMFVGFSAFAIIFQFRTIVMDWFRDALGTIAVTDRRIVFRSPMSGHIYFEIAADDVVSADLIETEGGYGWISVRRRIDNLDFEIYGVPEPDTALAAIHELMSTT
jgi:hypothetical protein